MVWFDQEMVMCFDSVGSDYFDFSKNLFLRSFALSSVWDELFVSSKLKTLHFNRKSSILVKIFKWSIWPFRYTVLYWTSQLRKCTIGVNNWWWLRYWSYHPQLWKQKCKWELLQDLNASGLYFCQMWGVLCFWSILGTSTSVIVTSYSKYLELFYLTRCQQHDQ